MRAVIYARVSSEEQLDGHSLSAQITLGKQHAENRGWQVMHIYEERGKSARSDNRPEFQRMIRDANAGLFDVIIVHKIDRFSRSVSDMMIYLKRLHGLEVTISSITEQAMDFSTPMGKLLFGLLALFAEWYVDNLSAEVSKGKRERARKGSWNGVLPFGYTYLRRLREEIQSLEQACADSPQDADKADLIQELQLKKTHYDKWVGSVYETDAIPDPINAAGVLLAFELYATGTYSDRDVADALNEAGYRTTGNSGNNVFGRDTVTPLLKNRFYIGETSYTGKKRGAKRIAQPGNHEAIIDEELFDHVQRVRKQRAKGRGVRSNRQYVYPLSSVLTCAECGGKWRGWKPRTKRRYRDTALDRGYTCNVDPRSVDAVDVEGEVAALITSLQIPSDWKEKIIARLSTMRTKEDDSQRERKTLEQRLDRLKKLFVMGDLDDETYMKERDQLQMQLSRLTVPVQGTVLDLERVSQLLNDSQALWNKATLKERKAWVLSLFQRIYIYKGHVCAVEPTPVLGMLLAVDGATDEISLGSNHRIKVFQPDTPLSVVRAHIASENDEESTSEEGMPDG